MKTTIGIALLLGTLALSPGLAAAEEHSLEQVVIEMAHTKAEHAALADHYRAKAKEARAEADRHAMMAAGYGGGKIAERQYMESHCKKISDEFRKIAIENDGLSQLHDAEAKKAK